MKTAKELGITKEIYEGLMLTRDALRDGKLKHAPDGEESKIKCAFNMAHWNDQTEYKKGTDCGTVACVGGWVEIIMKLPEGSAHRLSYKLGTEGGLHALFFPHQIGNWADLTPKMAAKAIDNYLNTGEPDWLNVVHGSRK